MLYPCRKHVPISGKHINTHSKQHLSTLLQRPDTPSEVETGTGLHETLDEVHSAWHAHGPFDGIIGFSQVRPRVDNECVATVEFVHAFMSIHTRTHTPAGKGAILAHAVSAIAWADKLQLGAEALGVGGGASASSGVVAFSSLRFVVLCSGRMADAVTMLQVVHPGTRTGTAATAAHTMTAAAANRRAPMYLSMHAAV